MTVTRRIEEGLLVLDVDAKSSYDEVMEHLSAGFSDPAFDPQRGVLLLFDRTHFVPTLDQIRRGSRFFVELLQDKPTRIALVTASAVHYGLGRILQAYCEHLGIELHVAREQPTARAWLKER